MVVPLPHFIMYTGWLPAENFLCSQSAVMLTLPVTELLHRGVRVPSVVEVAALFAFPPEARAHWVCPILVQLMQPGSSRLQMLRMPVIFPHNPRDDIGRQTKLLSIKLMHCKCPCELDWIAVGHPGDVGEFVLDFALRTSLPSNWRRGPAHRGGPESTAASLPILAELPLDAGPHPLSDPDSREVLEALADFTDGLRAWRSTSPCTN